MNWIHLKFKIIYYFTRRIVLYFNPVGDYYGDPNEKEHTGKPPKPKQSQQQNLKEIDDD